MRKRTLPKAAEPFMFKPGQSGNPKGRPPHPIENALRKATRQSLVRIIRMVCKGNVDYLRVKLKDPKTSALEAGVIASFLKAIEKGDYGTIEHIVQRVIGKIPDRVIVKATTNSTTVQAEITAATDDDLRKRLARIRAEI